MKSPISLLLLALALPSAPLHAAAPGPVVVPFVPEVAAVGANPRRSYPPSCLSAPLPTTPRGPVTTRTISLSDLLGTYNENVTVSMWRVACSGDKSAILVKFDRATARENTQPAPVFPIVGVARTGQNDLALRPAGEPNTVGADILGVSIISDSTVVLETYPVDGFQFNLNPAVTISLFPNNRRESFSVAAYDPDTHPDGNLSLEVTGYTTGTYFDPTRSGEGLFWEVAERGDGTRFAFFSWFTYAPDGRPTWIIGNVDVPAGVRTIQIPAFHFSGGGFAGNFNPANIVSRPWGNVRFTFRDCNNLVLEFDSTHSDANVPTGEGTRLWQRLSAINGFVCQ
jgi:hypothetical protein